MKPKLILPVLLLFLLALLIITLPLPIGSAQIPSPDTPIQLSGAGSNLTVYEFCQNQSTQFFNAKNDTTFSYLSDWYPTSYRGYHLHADIQNVRRTMNPVPNGDFEQYVEPGNNWTLADAGGTFPPLVKSVSNTTGGNPGSCLDIELAYDKVNFGRHAWIENNFTYTSSLLPDSLNLYFDVRFSPDITTASWLVIDVSIETSVGSTSANWITSTLNFHPTSWTTINVASIPVNGSLLLKIDVYKQIATNLDVDGHIYFDNFNFQIGSNAEPSEVELTLNGTAVRDISTNYGEVDIFADPALEEKVDIFDTWNITLLFTFDSPYVISFDFDYTMKMKTESPYEAQTSYTVDVNSDPLWTLNYTIPSGHPPPGTTGYQFGLFLPVGWQQIRVYDTAGFTVNDFSYNESLSFFLLDENIASAGDRFTISARSMNYVAGVYFQKSSSSTGPWENVTSSGYLLSGEYFRVIGILGSISSTGNQGSISIILPNGTVCNHDDTPTFNPVTNTVTSGVWQVPLQCEEFAGEDTTAIVSYSSGTEAGLTSGIVTIMNQAQITVLYPPPNSEVKWFPFLITIRIQNTNTAEAVTDAEVHLIYTNPQGQTLNVEMTQKTEGEYEAYFSPESFDAAREVTFSIEFYKLGYVNASEADGSEVQFSVIVNTGLRPEFELLTYGIIFLIILLAIWLVYSKGYRKRYVLPKREAHEKKLEEVLAIYNDVTNISRFLVLHRGSGIAIFDSMGERGRDGSLIGGFLQAIQAFAIDVNEEQRPKDHAPLSEITYEGFRVLINDGQHVRTAIVYRGTPSETLRQKLELFTKRFETDFQNELLNHGHEPRRFQKAHELLEEIFHISLLFPHEVVTKTGDIRLTNLESRLHFIALELNRQREYIYLSEIVNKYLETVNENPVELLNGIFQLREKQLIIPVNSTNSIS